MIVLFEILLWSDDFQRFSYELLVSSELDIHEKSRDIKIKNNFVCHERHPLSDRNSIPVQQVHNLTCNSGMDQISTGKAGRRKKFAALCLAMQRNDCLMIL